MNSNLEISFLSLLAYAALYLFGFLIFVIIFLLGSKLAESVSGLTELALKYRENGTMIGQTFSFQSAGFGDPWFPTSYSNCLTFVISTNGFFVEPMRFFRYLFPRLFIPWTAVKAIEAGSYWGLPSFRLKLINSWPTIQVYGSLGRAILEAWTASRSSLEMQKVS